MVQFPHKTWFNCSCGGKVSTIPNHGKFTIRFTAFCDNPNCDRVSHAIDGRTVHTALVNYFNALDKSNPERYV